MVGTYSEGYFIYHGDGSLLPGWPYTENGVPIGNFNIARVGDIDGDGDPEILFKRFRGGGPARLYAVSATGTLKPGWPLQSNSISFDSARLGDLDGDGALEIIARGSGPGPTTYAINGDAGVRPGWPITLDITQPYDEIYLSGTAVGDIDFDGRVEIVQSLTLYKNGYIVPSPVFVLNSDGTVRDGWPLIPPNLTTGLSRLLIADLDGDYSADVVGVSATGVVHSVKMNGTVVFFPVWSLGGVPGSPACGDIDNDGTLEIVIAAEELHVFDIEEGIVASTTGNLQDYGGISIGDVSGDGIQEIAAVSRSFNGLRGHYALHLFDRNLTELPGWPKIYFPPFGGERPRSAMGDLDGDGDLEIVNSHWDTVYVWDQPNPTGGPISVEWQMFLHDATQGSFYHHGALPEPVFIRGDANRSGVVDISDAMSLVGYLFVGAQNTCVDQLDVNSDAEISLTDALFILEHLFLSGPSPGPPFPECDASSGIPLPCVEFECP